MRRAAIASSVSVVAHAIALVSLSRTSPPATGGGAVVVTIVDARASDASSAAAVAAREVAPASPPMAHEPADRRPIPRARKRRVARVDPSPSPAAEPLPVAPDGDSRAGDDAAPPASTAPSPLPLPPTSASSSSSSSSPSSPSSSSVPSPPAPARPRGEPRPPGLDRDTCIANVDYPWRARLLDKEGMVRLRVVLGADGRVQSATVIQRAGYGFDETAVAAVKTRCRFTPAYDADGRPVPFVIDNYHFYFRLDDFDPRQRNWQQRW